ncbi:type II toxin-antitoxin system VapC family toxin [Labrys sp. KB_33_2]|uniref:type II toxin-antitoxin system VapC family toxin n=1 Tax=Labrys sp. KB_33_2 TaxID=3237479 RepID=UPI003F926B01
MIVVDANFLVLMFEPNAMPQVDRGHDRVTHFIDELARSKEDVMIPAPVLSEVVAGRIDRAEEIVQTLSSQRAFIIQDFTPVIAIETGYLIRAAVERSKAADRPPGWRVAMKYDAMVAATAIVCRARAICTDDGGFDPYVIGKGVDVLRITELALPPSKQEALPF